MAALSAATLIALWDTAARAAPHRRLEPLLAAAEEAEAIAEDTLGTRNRRILKLHRMLIGTPLEASVTCARCATQNEFVIPADAILAAPSPAAEVRVSVASEGGASVFRLPRMADIEAARRSSLDGDLRGAVLERCLVAGDGPVSEASAEAIGREFEALDPAANIVVDLACAGCAQSIAASVDPASFVARDLDRLVDGLFRDVDVIASAYGWNEATILALPPARRRRYVAMIAAARAPLRLHLEGRRA